MSGSHNGHSTINTDSIGYRAFALGVLAVAAVHFTLLRGLFVREFPLATLQGLIDGTAYAPFQYRFLIPWIVGKLHSLLGLDIVTLYQIIDGIAVICIVLATRYLLSAYLNGLRLDLISFGVILLLPWNYLLPQEIALFIPSDLPAVAFFTALLALGMRRKWRWYFPLFALATFNRETTCFVTLALVFAHYRDISRSELIKLVGAQFIIWVAVKTALYIAFAENPGSLFEIYGISEVRRSHLDANLEFLMSPLRVLILLSSCGFLWISAIIFRSRITDVALRRSLLSLVVFFVAMLVIGNLNETRIFGEFIPMVYAANVLIVRSAIEGG